MNNADEIFAVEGVDICFVGPFDLSISMGFKGKQDDPKFQAAVDKVLEAAKRHNVVPGMWLGAGRPVTERLRAGWKFISIGLDLNLLVDGTKAALKKSSGLKGGAVSRERWNERYRERSSKSPLPPNVHLEKLVADLEAGTALDLAAGDGEERTLSFPEGLEGDGCRFFGGRN